MAVFNYAKKEIDAKIVYYGPAISGKTTNLQFIHQHLKPDQRGKMVSLATNEDRTLFFDFLPIELESVRGFKTRFHLYTVPGQVYYGATRRAVLTGADGVVFVADSHAERMEDNLASLKDLEDNLRYYGKKVENTPLIIQYNKRDLPDLLTIEELNHRLNRLNTPYFESIAILGKGVFESLTMICRMVLKAIENGVDSRRTVGIPERTSMASSGRPIRLEKGSVQPESPVPRQEVVSAGAALPEKGVAQVRPPSTSVLETLRVGGQKPKREASVPQFPEPGETMLPAEEKIEEEKKAVPPALYKPTPEKKKQEISFRIDKKAAEKTSGGKEKLRILARGEPLVSSANSLEIPLTLEVETAGKSFSFPISLAIKMDSIDSKVE
jgi:signal recognition particle receptor subunit beta